MEVQKPAKNSGAGNVAPSSPNTEGTEPEVAGTTPVETPAEPTQPETPNAEGNTAQGSEPVAEPNSGDQAPSETTPGTDISNDSAQPSSGIDAPSDSAQAGDDVPKAGDQALPQSDAAPADGDVAPPPVPAASPDGKPVDPDELGSTEAPGIAAFKSPLRRVIEFCARHNAVIHRALFPGEVEDALAKKGLTLDDVETPVNEIDYWKADGTYSGDGPASFTSLDGWWTASMFPNGAFEVTRLANTPVAARRSGQRDSADQTFKSDSLEVFRAMLDELQAAGDEIIETSLAEVERRHQAHEQALVQAEIDAAKPVEPDPDSELIAKAGAEMGVQHLSGQALEVHLAAAHGVPTHYPELDEETGNQKLTDRLDHNGASLMDPSSGAPFQVPAWGDPRPHEEIRADLLDKLKAGDSAAA